MSLPRKIPHLLRGVGTRILEFLCLEAEILQRQDLITRVLWDTLKPHVDDTSCI